MMNCYSTVPLGLIADIIMGQAPHGSTYNEEQKGLPLIAGAGDLGDRFPRPSKWTTLPNQVCRKGDIIFCIRATIGLMNWADKEYCLGRGVAAIRTKENLIDREYLYYYLETSTDKLKMQASGSTFVQIRRQDIENLQIPLPPLPEQRRIAAILREADAIRRLRREANEKMQKVIEALFYDMFGDCNPHKSYPTGWHVAPLANVIHTTQYGLSESMEREEGIGVLRMNNISIDGWLDFSDLKYFPHGSVNLEKYGLSPGDLLFNRTNSKELVGKTGLWEEVDGVFTFASYIIRVRLNKNVAIPEYIWALLNSPYGKQQVFSISKQAVNMANINTQELGAIQVVLPPHSLQQQFASHVKILSGLRKFSSLHGESLDALYQSLLAQAFTGELTATWREAHREELAQAAQERDELLRQLHRISEIVVVPRPAEVEIETERAELFHELTLLQRALLNSINQQYERYFGAGRLYEEIKAHQDEQYNYIPALDEEGLYRDFDGLDCSLDGIRRDLHFLAAIGLLKELALPAEDEMGDIQFITVYRSLHTDDDSQQQDLVLLDDEFEKEVLV